MRGSEARIGRVGQRFGRQYRYPKPHMVLDSIYTTWESSDAI